MKHIIRNLIRKFPSNIVKLPFPSSLGKDPLDDMAKYLHNDRPVVFDVGANVGQSIHRFRSQFPRCIINSFEPSPTTFKILSQQASELEDVRLWNCALGSASEQMIFLENSHSYMSSFLPLSEFGWGKITKETSVEVRTIDQFCHDEQIEHIDILKSDTQGFELEVFKGAEGTIRANKIGLIYFEIIFSDMYKNLPSFAKVYEYLTLHDFLLVSFYEFHYQMQLASWTDALFVHKSYIQPSK
ncbi:FkbM family methyltransferase [Microcoleus sp. A003_D6]|uniref:FkbM family methyltransferase n=1 Tax=Microcoleus sp. A003_D6 TaxID=3055266 RepID=UPI002FCFB3ED